MLWPNSLLVLVHATDLAILASHHGSLLLQAEREGDDIEEMQTDELGEFEIERILMYADKLAEHCVSRIAAEKGKEKIAAFDEETSGLMDLVEGKKAEGDDLSYLLCFSTCVSDCCNNAASALFINKQIKASLKINYKVLKIRGLIHGANSIAAAESLQNISCRTIQFSSRTAA